MATFDRHALRGIREGKGLSATHLAALARVRRERIYSWESGRAHPNPESVAQLASALNVSIGDLYKVSDPPTLEDLRLAHGYTQEAIAEKIDRARRSYHLIEAGDPMPEQVKESLAEVYGVSVNIVENAAEAT